MAARVVWYRDAWWVRIRWSGDKKRDRRIGATKTDKKTAEQIAARVNAELTLGKFAPEQESEGATPLLCANALLKWHRTYAPTFKPSFEISSRTLIDRHLLPFFGRQDLREIREEHLLAYIQAKLSAGQRPATISTALSVLRRVLSLAVQEGSIPRNPASRLGALMSRVDRRAAAEVRQAEAWTREEVETLLRVVGRHDPRFAPI